MSGPAPGGTPRLRVEPPDVLVTTLKPADDGRGWIVRLFGASGHDRQATLTWAAPRPTDAWISDTAEQRLSRIEGKINVPGMGLGHDSRGDAAVIDEGFCDEDARVIAGDAAL